MAVFPRFVERRNLSDDVTIGVLHDVTIGVLHDVTIGVLHDGLLAAECG